MKFTQLFFILVLTLGLVFVTKGQELTNYLEDPGFEWGIAFEDTVQVYEPGGPPGWTGWFSNSIVDDLNPYSGTWCATILEIPVEGDYDDGGFGQVVELNPGENYIMTGFARLDWITWTDSEWGLYLGVQAFGRDKVQANLWDSEWTPVVLEFTMGDTNTWADVWGWRGPGGEASFDDFGVWDQHNFLDNGGFEDDLNGWEEWQYGVSVTSDTNNVLEGNYSLEINGFSWGGGCAQYVTNLKPGATYGLQGSLKVTAEGDTITFGVKRYGGEEKTFYVGNTAYTQGTLSFTMPADSTNAEIYIWTDDEAQFFADDFLLVQMIDPDASAAIDDPEINSFQPKKYALEQNYPNPFNPTTAISYQLSAVSDVDLSIYNLLGQKVATLVNGRQPAGEYKVEWDAGNHASGVYYYMIKAGEFHQVKKMVLMK
jgi:hypothetical protein